MGWFDSTSAILGVKGLEQQKKNDRWSKLMDIASLLQSTAGMGADLWKTVSGRKHDFALASVGQGYGVINREDEQAHDVTMENLRLENDKSFQQFKQDNPDKPADQLYAEWLMTEDGKAWQAEQERLRREGATFDFGLDMKKILANQGGGMSENGWTTYDNAKANAISTYYEQDEMGKYVLRQGVTQDTVREFLYGFLAPAFTSSSDVEGLRRAFDLWLNNPDFPGQDGGDGGTDKDMSEMVRQILEGIAKLNSSNPPQRVPTGTNDLGGAGSSDAGGVGTGLGTGMLDQSNRERQLEDGLQWFTTDKSVAPADQALAKEAYSRSKKTGFLSEEDYNTFAKVLEMLKQKYGGTKVLK